MKSGKRPDTHDVPAKPGITWNANLNRILMAMAFFVWVAWVILRFATELSSLVSVFAFFAAFIAYLFPGIREFHNHAWFKHSLITAGLAILFTAGGMLDLDVIARPALAQPSLPVNVTKILDFEGELSKEITLDICDLEPLYHGCFDATSRLALSGQGFSGRNSLAETVQLKSEKGQIYSTNFPISPPAFLAAVTAHINLPEATIGTTIRLMARVYGKDEWKINDYLVQKAGWTRVFLDLQSAPEHDISIDEVDIDLLIPPGLVSSQIEARIDDIEMFYNPLSKKTVFPVDAVIEQELLRVKNEEKIDIGEPISAFKTVTSHLGNEYIVQTFQNGEVYERDGKAHILYGPIYEKFKQANWVNLGFPINDILHIKSWLKSQGDMMEFEGLGGGNQPSSFIFSSNFGSAIIEGWIENKYEENGGPTGWLGLPINDPVERDQSTLQFFENGYIVYYFPKVDGKTDNNRPPVAFPYIGGSMNVIDVKANQATWQDTGLEVQPGQRVYIVQLGGSWRYYPQLDWFDANGNDELWEKSRIPIAPHGAMIGKIGEDDSYQFNVGRWKIVSPKKSGHLYLMMNDDEYDDNEGIISVQLFVFKD